MIKISSVSRLKKSFENCEKENSKPLTVSFHLSQSNSHRRSDYCSALSRIAATDAIVLSSSQSVTYHAISKFREELLKSRYRYIEKVTGNYILLITIFFIMFVREERYIPKIASPQKLRLSKSLFQAQTLIGLKLWLYFSLSLLTFFSFILYIHSQYHFFY